LACESVTPPTVAVQIKSLGNETAAAVAEAIARIERDGDHKYQAPDKDGGPEDYFNLSVPGIVIKYTMLDDGAAFEVTAVRRFFIG
jgi:hypothetical protein